MANSGHYNPAVDLFTEAIKLDPMDFRYDYTCASFLSSVGNPSGCASSFLYLYSFVVLVNTPFGVVIHCHATMLVIPICM